MSCDNMLTAEHGDAALRTGVITLNRPKQLDALNSALMDDLGAARLKPRADKSVPVRRKLGSTAYKPFEPAPGRHVKVKAAAQHELRKRRDVGSRRRRVSRRRVRRDTRTCVHRRIRIDSGVRVMRVSVIGGTGMIGSRVVAEAARRGHEVTALSRSGTAVKGATKTRAMELTETPAVSALIEASDATVIAVSPDRSGGSQEPTLQAHRDLIAAHPNGRLLVIGGAGSLVISGVQLKDAPGFPAAYYNEATTLSTILDLYRASKSLDWTVLSPPPLIRPGERTGAYRLGVDSPVGEAISAEDFAVAVVDELEDPAHKGTRFTVAN